MQRPDWLAAIDHCLPVVLAVYAGITQPDRRDLRRQCPSHRIRIIESTDDDGARATVFQHVADRVRTGGWIDRHRYQARHRNGDIRDQPLGAIFGEDGNPVAGCKPELQQCRCKPRRVVVRLPKGPFTNVALEGLRQEHALRSFIGPIGKGIGRGPGRSHWFIGHQRLGTGF